MSTSTPSQSDNGGHSGGRPRAVSARSVATGALTLSYRWDGSSSVADTKTWQFSDVATKGYALYQFPIKNSFYKRLKYKLTHNDDLSACDITRVTFLVSPESANAIF